MANPFDEFDAHANPFDEFDEQPSENGLLKELKRRGKAALGGLDAALTTAAQAIPYAASGAIAAGSVPFIGASEAENFRKDMLENGLGLGGANTVTKEGEEILGGIGDFAGAVKEEAGLGAEKFARSGQYGDLGEKAANAFHLGSDLVLGGWGNFTPVPGGKAVRKAGAALEKWGSRNIDKTKGRPAADIDSVVSGEKAQTEVDEALRAKVMQKAPKRTPASPMDSMANNLAGDQLSHGNESPVLGKMADDLQTPFPTNEAMGGNPMNTELLQRAREAAAQREAAARQAQAEADAKTTMYVDKDGVAFTQPVSLAERMAQDRARQLRDQQRANELSQQELLDADNQGGGANPFEAQQGEWRLDENGIPVRVDISMEAHNLENPLQRNLFGDELPPRETPRGQAAEASHQDVSPEHIGITEAMDRTKHDARMAETLDDAVTRLDQVQKQVDSLSHDIPADGALERAKLDADNEGNASMANRPISSSGKFSRQRGAVDPRLLARGFSKLYHGGRAFLRWDPHMVGRGEGMGVMGPGLYASDNRGHAERYVKYGTDYDFDPNSVDGVVVKPGVLSEMAVDMSRFFDPRKAMSPEQHAAWKRAEAALDKMGLRASQRGVKSALQSAGDKQAARKAMVEAGVDGIWEDFGDQGREIVIYNPDVIAQVSDAAKPVERMDNLPPRVKGLGQRGAVGRDLRPRPSQTGADATPTTPVRPAVDTTKTRPRQWLSKNFPVKNGPLSEFDVIRTKEEALELSKTAKDIGPNTLKRKNLGSGLNFQTIMSNNPLLKWARTILADARHEPEAFSRQYITSKDGLSPTWEGMSSNERVAVMEALQSGDRHQTVITDAMMDKLGFTDKQRQFIKTFYEADKKLFTAWSKALESVGLKVVNFRTGHFPGIFTGAYKTLVMRPVVRNGVAIVGKDGKPKLEVAAVLATDTKAQAEIARRWAEKEIPGSTFIEQKRQQLQGSNRYYSDIFSGMNDLMEILSKNDPRFADIQEIVNGAVAKANNHLFNFNVHELAKKGVSGNEGNKPWLSPERNANDAFKALVRYFEEGAQHHALQAPLKEIQDAMTASETDHMPNAKAYLNEYTKHITGQDLNPLGAAINTILDEGAKLIPTVSWGTVGGKTERAVAFGTGGTVPLKVTGAIKNEMSHVFMGWGNYTFTGAQLVQPLQTGLPFMQLAASRLGLRTDHAVASMGRGAADFMQAYIEDKTGNRIDSLPEHMRQAYQRAKDRGMLEFSEMERAYQGTQSKLGRVKDQVAEINMKVGEQFTRTPMFMAFTDLLVKGEVPIESALAIAENLTDFSMINYHPWERPMLYQKLGVAGRFASGLTTFKHGFMSQQTYLAKQAIKPAVGNRQVLPMAMSAAAMLTFAGITGSPFYDELDTAVRGITNTFMGEQKSIRELALNNLPEWSKTGIVSNATGLSLQGKFSSADMVPNNIAKGASPYLEAFGEIVGNIIDAAKNGADPQSIRNLIMSIMPQGPAKGVAENLLSRDSNNNLIGKQGLPMNDRPRTDKEWNIRAATGLRTQEEAIQRSEMWDSRQKRQADQMRLKEISAEYKRAIINDTIGTKAAKLEEEYQKRGGDVKSLINLYGEAETERALTEKQRLEGVPKNLNGARRWQYFNK